MELSYADYVWDEQGRGFRQRDLTITQTYDAGYLRRYESMDDRVRALSAERVRIFEMFAGKGAGRSLLDYGCGTGRVVEAARESGWDAYGCDVVRTGNSISPENAAEANWDAVTFFDSLEHVVAPDAVIRNLAAEWVMISVPCCHYPNNENWFMRWRHRRPGEHLWNWNRDSLNQLLCGCGYTPVMHSEFEDEFRRNPDQREPNILTAIYRRLV